MQTGGLDSLVWLSTGCLLFHTRCKSDEEHKNRTLWVAVANSRGHGWEPFIWVALGMLLVKLEPNMKERTNVELILYDLVVM